MKPPLEVLEYWVGHRRVTIHANRGLFRSGCGSHLSHSFVISSDMTTLREAARIKDIAERNTRLFEIRGADNIITPTTSRGAWLKRGERQIPEPHPIASDVSGDNRHAVFGHDLGAEKEIG